MDGTCVSGSSSGQAVGFDPGGLSHFCRANPGHCEIQRPPTEAAYTDIPILDSRPSPEASGTSQAARITDSEQQKRLVAGA
jgi:hypothetical protein